MPKPHRAEEFAFRGRAGNVDALFAVPDTAPRGVGLIEPDDFDVWAIEHRFKLASGVTMFSAILRHANHALLHRQRE